MERWAGDDVGAVSVRRVCCVFDLPPSITRSLYIPITNPPFPPKVLSSIHKTHITLIQFIRTEVPSFPHKPCLGRTHRQAATTWKISAISTQKSSCPTRCAKSCLNARRAPGLCCLSAASMYTGFMVEALSIILPRGQ